MAPRVEAVRAGEEHDRWAIPGRHVRSDGDGGERQWAGVEEPGSLKGLIAVIERPLGGTGDRQQPAEENGGGQPDEPECPRGRYGGCHLGSLPGAPPSPLTHSRAVVPSRPAA